MSNPKAVSSMCLFAAGLLLVNTAGAVPPPTGVAPVEPPAGGFAVDGNLLANMPTANLGDWLVNTNLAPGTGSRCARREWRAAGSHAHVSFH